MRAHGLTITGLSLSQAQSISNLINQTVYEIDSQLVKLNNSKKELVYQGATMVQREAHPIPAGIVDMLSRKGKLYGTLAFLMENIKAKDHLIKQEQSRTLDYSVFEDVPSPTLEVFRPLPFVSEEFGWEQLTVSEMSEYYEQEALASHVGQFIHKGGILDKLRIDLATAPTLEMYSVTRNGQPTQYPLLIDVHHTPERLMELHTELSVIHRKANQRVNYYKAKVKNLTSDENARIAQVNKDESERIRLVNNTLNNQFLVANQALQAQIKTAQEEFNKEQFENIKAISALRILIPNIFQPIIDEFLVEVPEEIQEQSTEESTEE